ncbi:hypothetical protein HETIRDRAFT_317149 [Heterobasidion irregulare TC 32-1]|uniref:Uncharacterized protein n=1 Tax=Heterobasidion irregulare (strain TC 32-1) TaxID=747525 RepID=W4K7M3_HETIT|nr:uncharacterized protein HETIRDRAFT_317149 [Heterobasidion irregulare TC 32-1]ETW81817.1 hypothetical protein HETIRDRAFT_317149 [Heterobasidion irregulare TC 32-1]
MVQGKTKGLQAKTANPRHAHKAAANMKKGRRDVAPKKTVLVKQAVMHKSLSAKINKSVEQQMVNAASSGKLTIMKNLVSEG